MDDRSGPGLDHRWDQTAIEAHGSEKVELQSVVPELWGERREPAGRGGGATAGDVDDDVHAAVAGRLLDHVVGSLDGGDVGGEELVCGEVLHGVAADRGDVCPGGFQACGHGGAGSPGAARDEGALAGQVLGLDAWCASHGAMRSRVIRSPARVKSHFSSAVPPGKLPVSRPVITKRSGVSASVARMSVV